MSTTAAGFDLSGFLARERALVESALEAVCARHLAGAPPELAEPILYAVRAGGKRLRPILCVAAYRTVAAPRTERDGADGSARAAVPTPVYELAAALELIHTYSLVHDDLPCMDDDELRRGRPSTHVVYGGSRAVAAGAALIPIACATAVAAGRALGLPADARARLAAELCRAAGPAGMVGGQWLDLEAEGRALAAPELESLHRMKTGALLTAAVRLGAIAAGADAERLGALDAYGRAVGLAFQIADDVLDVTGRAADLGKTAGRDAELGKATYPALLGVERARRRAVDASAQAAAALRRGGLESVALERLARFAVERDR